MDYSLLEYKTERAPYEELYDLRVSPFDHRRRLEELSADAKSKGFGGFKSMYAAFCKEKSGKDAVVDYQDSYSDFTGQPIELNTGEWKANDVGIRCKTDFGEVVACTHPIMPVKRLVNVDTGIEKLEIAYSHGNKWRSIIVEKGILASAQKIVALADIGIAVNSETAKYLVKYLADVEHINYDDIPTLLSVGRLGHIEETFSPYGGLIFDGDKVFAHLYSTVHEKGSFDEWKRIIRKIRKGSVEAKIVIAASFASALVEPLGCLPFFVHLWGAESGTGKTVALMAATSVWADPYPGQYMQTFNSTSVGLERLAGFLNSMPLVMDELQLTRASGKEFSVYGLAEGVGRTRGNKVGGIDMTPTWHNCILTCGESPITGSAAGAGAKNRVLELECTSGNRIVEDGHGAVEVLRKNYGFAGKRFVELMAPDNIEAARTLFTDAYQYLTSQDTTEKQAMAAALILTADFFVGTFILEDEYLTQEQIAAYLRTVRDVDVNERAYSFLVDWVAQNSAYFVDGFSEVPTTCYGKLNNGSDEVCIIRTVFNNALSNAGYSDQAFLSWAKARGKIRTRPQGSKNRNLTVPLRIGGILTECVALKLPTETVDMLEPVGTDVPTVFT